MMPSPFPGMDPYLESPVYWRDVHHWLISNITEYLNSALPENYAAAIDERLYLVEPDRSVFPDVLVSRMAPDLVGVGSSSASTSRDVEAPWKVSVTPPEEIAEAFIKVQQLRPERGVVTIIEVLSPTNKTGGVGRDIYLQKQQEVHEQEIALLELDLLRGGMHTVAAPLRALQRRGTWDYLACLHRAGLRQEWEVWPIRLREPLPEVLVPLADNDPDLPLPLQPLLDRAYQRGRYSIRVNYRQEPETPLREEDAAWARELLRPHREGGEGT